jgi:hypothetical protein
MTKGDVGDSKLAIVFYDSLAGGFCAKPRSDADLDAHLKDTGIAVLRRIP